MVHPGCTTDLGVLWGLITIYEPARKLVEAIALEQLGNENKKQAK